MKQFAVHYPPGCTVIKEFSAPVDNYLIACDLSRALLRGESVVVPAGTGWNIQVFNQDQTFIDGDGI